MRKITEKSIKAFMNAEQFKESNTEVEVLPNVTILRLFGNAIAYRYNDPNGTISVTTAGWNTPTTLNRLNGLPFVKVGKRKGQLYINDYPWDGSLVDVLPYETYSTKK
jgi:hypothetical protein